MKGNEAIGERVRKLRLKKNITMRWLVFKVGNLFSISQLSAMETEKKAFPDEALTRIAEALGTTVEYLKTGKDGVAPPPAPAASAEPDMSLWEKLEKAKYIVLSLGPDDTIVAKPYETAREVEDDIAGGHLLSFIINRRMVIQTRIEFVLG